MRPGPLSAPVSWPTAGPTTVTPLACSVAMLACVAGLRHISVCMAGAMTIGASLASTVLPSRSSASPVASFAIVLAVAGRDHDEVGRLADRDVAHLGDPFVEVDVHRVARDRLERRTPDEPQCSLGGHDVDVMPGEHECPHDADGLVRGDAAGDADDDVEGHAALWVTRPAGGAGACPR